MLDTFAPISWRVTMITNKNQAISLTKLSNAIQHLNSFSSYHESL